MVGCERPVRSPRRGRGSGGSDTGHRRCRYLGRALAAVVVVTAMVGRAQAVPGGTPLNGRYLVTSNGDWAQTNEVYHNEKTVRQEWTITSSCADSSSCTGKVTSSQGWSADLRYFDSWWTVTHAVEKWEPCPDGSAAPGKQHFQFWGVDRATGFEDESNSRFLVGNDVTYGVSGSCGISRQQVINLPLRVQKIDH
jgi:hypothetical protein